LPPLLLTGSAPFSHSVITMANQDGIADLRNNVKRGELLKHALVRAANDAYAQGGVLTCTNLSILFHRGRSHVAQLIREYEVETGEVVQRQGNIHHATGKC
jgi:hypothetical protein